MTESEFAAALEKLAREQQAASLARVPHVRAEQPRTERRIRRLMQETPVASTLCGAAVTDRDILRQEVTGFTPPPGGKPLCERCKVIAGGGKP